MKGFGGSDIFLKGKIPLNPEGVDFKVKIFLPGDISKELVKAANHLDIFLNDLLITLEITRDFG